MVWVQLAILIATTVLSSLLAPKPKAPKAAGLDELDFPTAEEDRPIAELLGTRWLKAPNVVWWGDLRVKPLRVSAGPFGGKTTVGFQYNIGVHMVFARKLDTLLAIKVADKVLIDSLAITANTVLHVDQPELFGDAKAEGGISGDMSVMFGAADQPADDYLASVLAPAPVPGYRGVFGIVARQMNLGNAKTPQPWSVLGTRQSTGWYPAKEAIGLDMNPAHMMRMVLTTRDFAELRVLTSRIDEVSFTAAADTLYAENFGLSFLIGQDGSSVEDFIQEVLRHIDGSLFEDKRDGLWKLVLNRADYVVDDLLLLDQSNADTLDFEQIAWGQVTNTVSVIYYDRDSDSDKSTAPHQDMSVIEIEGGSVSEVLRFPGITNGELATKVAQRELNARNRPLARVTLEAHRIASKVGIGQPFRWQNPRRGVPEMILRAVRIDYGTLDDGRIRIEAVQDVFSLPAAVFAAPGASRFVSPLTAPQVMTRRAVIEAPYWFALNAGVASSDIDTSGYLLTAGSPPDGTSIGYDVWARTGADPFTELSTGAGMVPSATLTADIGPAATVVAITGAVNASDFAIGSLVLIGGIEIARIDATSATTLTLSRGVLDTTPQPHSIAAVVLGFDDVAFERSTYALGTALDVKLVNANLSGSLAQASVPVDALTFSQRAMRPYPPAGLTINGQSYPATAAGQIIVSARTRNRVIQGVNIVDQSAASIVHEAGTTYTARWLLNASLVRTASGLPAPEDVFTPASNGTVSVELSAVRGSLASNQVLAHTFAYTTAGGSSAPGVGPLPLFVFSGAQYAAQASAFGFGGTVTWTRVGTGTPANLVNVSATGAVSFTSPGSGQVQFTLRATDGTDTIDRVFTVTVQGEVSGTPALIPNLDFEAGASGWTMPAPGVGTFTIENNAGLADSGSWVGHYVGNPGAMAGTQLLTDGIQVLPGSFLTVNGRTRIVSTGSGSTTVAIRVVISSQSGSSTFADVHSVIGPFKFSSSVDGTLPWVDLDSVGFQIRSEFQSPIWLRVGVVIQNPVGNTDVLIDNFRVTAVSPS